MNIYIKKIILTLYISFSFLISLTYGQITMSKNIIANGGGEMTDSYILVGTFGQPIVESTGIMLKSGFWSALKISTNIEDNAESKFPKEYKLDKNYPNPFNPTTTINYQLPKTSSVSLIIYDLLGRQVRTLVNKEQIAGYYNIQLDATLLTSGIYFYRIITSNGADSFVQTKKMILLK